PSSDAYNPGIYASATMEDKTVLDEFVGLSSQFGLNIISTERGRESGGASALKMAHAGIVKGATGLFVSMILCKFDPRHRTSIETIITCTSPSIVQGLLHALSILQPAFIDLKEYRFVKEMEKISGFVGGGEGIEKVFERVAAGPLLTHVRMAILGRHSYCWIRRRRKGNMGAKQGLFYRL
ncbi:hypothetical protein L218DRAFT_860460, partial [Marasmius fiardii PR-910]